MFSFFFTVDLAKLYIGEAYIFYILFLSLISIYSQILEDYLTCYDCQTVVVHYNESDGDQMVTVKVIHQNHVQMIGEKKRNCPLVGTTLAKSIKQYWKSKKKKILKLFID